MPRRTRPILSIEERGYPPLASYQIKLRIYLLLVWF